MVQKTTLCSVWFKFQNLNGFNRNYTPLSIFRLLIFLWEQGFIVHFQTIDIFVGAGIYCTFSDLIFLWEQGFIVHLRY